MVSLLYLEPGTYDLTISYVGMDSVLIKSIKVSSEKVSYINDVQMTSGKLRGYTTFYWERPIDKENPSVEP